MIYPQGGFGPFLSTPSARRATAGRHGSSATVAISIHALREEGDPPSSKSGRPSANFYPRPPRGGRLFCAARAASSRVFLSTPSARRATRAGEPFLLLPEISIHALREEGDPITKPCSSKLLVFLSTPSARRATYFDFRCFCFFSISIHALREEGDTRHSGHSTGNTNFYPRPPRGGRPGRGLPPVYAFWNFYPRPPRGGRHRCLVDAKRVARFLSTPSARRATRPRIVFAHKPFISIHALREEGDSKNRDKISIFL